MIQVRPTEPGLALPNDQDASGRTLGDGGARAPRRRDPQRHAHEHEGHAGARARARASPRCSASSDAVACSSGTAAIHAAIAAIDPEPGDEIVTTPITDMGALAPILYQGAIPVFADVDPRTGNVTADADRRPRSSDRTRAIVVTHLFGNPCDDRRDPRRSPTRAASR